MISKKKILIPIVIILIAACVILFLFLKNNTPKNIVTGSGTIEATEIDISSRLSGEILEITKNEGDAVFKGELLVTIRADELLARRTGFEAQHIEAQRNFLRAKSLFEVGGISKMDFDRAETQYLSAKAQLESVDASLKDARLFSPISGVILLKNFEVGEIAFPGAAIVTLADLSRVMIHIYIDEPYIGLVSLGDEAHIAVDSFPERDFIGAVTYISDEPEFTPKNVQTKEERTKLVFAIKIELENPDGALKPGMPADAEIIIKGKK